MSIEDLTKKIEAILFFKNEPLTYKEIAKILSCSDSDIKSALSELQIFYKDRGMVIVDTGEEISFGTHPDHSEMIENLQKEELSRDLGRAGLETLSIILYKGPISRREIDYIRGVNSSFIIRNLLIRGLIERSNSETGERSYSYKPTLQLFQFLGITKREDLPEFSTAFKKIEEFSAGVPLDLDKDKGEDIKPDENV